MIFTFLKTSHAGFESLPQVRVIHYMHGICNGGKKTEKKGMTIAGRINRDGQVLVFSDLVLCNVENNRQLSGQQTMQIVSGF